MIGKPSRVYFEAALAALDACADGVVASVAALTEWLAEDAA